MAHVPAICPNCHRVFPVRIRMLGPGVLASLRNNKAACECGGWANIVDGDYEFIDHAVKIIANSAQSAEQIRDLLSILEDIKEKNLSPSEAIDELSKSYPAFRRIGDLLRLKNPTEFFTAVTALATVAQILVTALDKTDSQPPLPPINVTVVPQVNVPGNIPEDVLQRAIERALKNESGRVEERKQPAEATEHDGRDQQPILRTKPPTKGAKARRNDPCPCGSGKKYKRCCLML